MAMDIPILTYMCIYRTNTTATATAVGGNGFPIMVSYPPRMHMVIAYALNIAMIRIRIRIRNVSRQTSTECHSSPTHDYYHDTTLTRHDTRHHTHGAMMIDD